MMHSSPDSDVAIQNTLQVMGEFLHSERTYIFEIYGRLMDNTYEWCAPGISAEINRLKDIPVTDIRRWMSSFQRGECIIIKDLEELKESDPLEYRRLKPQNIRTLVTVPLIEMMRLSAFSAWIIRRWGIWKIYRRSWTFWPAFSSRFCCASGWRNG